LIVIAAQGNAADLFFYVFFYAFFMHAFKAMRCEHAAHQRQWLTVDADPIATLWHVDRPNRPIKSEFLV